MPQSFLIFDFGTNEEAAQQARHRLEGWKQGLRLGDKLKFKFERKPAEPPAEPPAEAAAEPEKKKKSTKAKATKSAKTTKAKAKTKKKEPAAEPAAAKEAPGDRLRVLVRLEFSDHEKLTFQRYLDRIPAEAPFPMAEKQIVRRGQEGFHETATLFDELP
jgi:hypothetical protein